MSTKLARIKKKKKENLFWKKKLLLENLMHNN